MRASVLFAPLLLAPVLGGCVMGPNFDHVPPPPASLGKTFVRAGDVSITPAPRLAPWWRDLDDPLMNQLIMRALSSSPSIAVAEARVRKARSQVRGARANMAPVVGLGAGAGGARAPALVTGGGADSSSVFLTGFDALWEIDLFGGRQRAIEVTRAQLDIAQADVDDARLSLTTEVARDYIALRASQQRLGVASQALSNQQNVAELTTQLEGAGKASRIEREQADRDLGGKRQAVTALEAELNDHRDAIAALIGEASGALDALLDAPGVVPLPPATVTVGDPAAMLARRPDIRSAEHRLRVANAGIGIAQAARMPRLSLAGVIGLGGPLKGDMTSADNLFSLAGPTLQWNVADFGRGSAALGQARAGRDEAEARYRMVVLSALQDAEGSLNRYGAARKTLAVEAGKARSARTSAGLVEQSWRAGRTSRLAALATENEQLAAQDAQIRAQAALSIDYVALQKALALGWAGAPG